MDDARRTRARAAPFLAVEAVLATGATLAIAIRFELASAWLLVAIVATLARRRSLDDLALEPRFTPPTLAAHAVALPVLLGAYAAGHLAVAVAFADAHVVPALPPDLGPLLAHHLLVVAAPEEVFFRGYLQSTLDRAFPAPRRTILGAEVGPAIVLQAALFALCHLATGDWTRLRVGAFGLLAGWLRARTGGVAAPILYHALANVTVTIVEASLR